jgi:hypothetical protein
VQRRGGGGEGQVTVLHLGVGHHRGDTGSRQQAGKRVLRHLRVAGRLQQGRQPAGRHPVHPGHVVDELPLHLTRARQRHADVLQERRVEQHDRRSGAAVRGELPGRLEGDGTAVGPPGEHRLLRTRLPAQRRQDPAGDRAHPLLDGWFAVDDLTGEAEHLRTRAQRPGQRHVTEQRAATGVDQGQSPGPRAGPEDHRLGFAPGPVTRGTARPQLFQQLPALR